MDDWLILVANSMGMDPLERKRVGHIYLLTDAGLMIQVGHSSYRLTNEGHDYLESIRDEGIWSKTKKAVAETGGNATLEIIKDLAIGFLKKQISDRTGIDL